MRGEEEAVRAEVKEEGGIIYERVIDRKIGSQIWRVLVG